MVNHIVLSIDWNIFLCFYSSFGSSRAGTMEDAAWKVTYVIYTLFPTAHIILGSRHYTLYFLTLDNRCFPWWTETGTFPQSIPSYCN